MLDFFELFQVKLTLLFKTVLSYLIAQAGFIRFVMLMRRVGRVDDT